MWWSFGDYNEFQKTAKVDFERCGHDWSQLPEDEEELAEGSVGKTKGEVGEEEQTDIALTEILSEEEEHAALVSFLSHKPVCRPDSPSHGMMSHSLLPSGVQLVKGAVEVECDEMVKNTEDQAADSRPLSHSKSCPTLYDQEEEEEDLAQEETSLNLDLPELPPFEGAIHHSPKRLASPRCTASPQRVFRIVDSLDLASSSPMAHAGRLHSYASQENSRRSLDDMNMQQVAPESPQNWELRRGSN